LTIVILLRIFNVDSGVAADLVFRFERSALIVDIQPVFITLRILESDLLVLDSIFPDIIFTLGDP